ncbi:hypothetical protein H1C71_028366, partial [Ictidomys tridecemlineatus]
HKCTVHPFPELVTEDDSSCGVERYNMGLDVLTPIWDFSDSSLSGSGCLLPLDTFGKPELLPEGALRSPRRFPRVSLQMRTTPGLSSAPTNRSSTQDGPRSTPCLSSSHSVEGP